jgi:hypothetical protein
MWHFRRFKPAWARMINGEQEGIYGWIALNYLTGYLSPHPFSASKAASVDTDADSALNTLQSGNRVMAASQGLKTVGALDLGGSSLEVTFIPSKLTPESVKGLPPLMPHPESLLACVMFLHLLLFSLCIFSCTSMNAPPLFDRFGVVRTNYCTSPQCVGGTSSFWLPHRIIGASRFGSMHYS